MKKVFGILAFLEFLLILGTLGAVEMESISLRVGIVRAGFGMVWFVLFCKLAGAFETYIPEKQKPVKGKEVRR